MIDETKLPEPQRTDWFIEKLGQTQQKLMALTVKCRRLEIAEQKARERAEVLEELVMDVADDLAEGVAAYKIDYRIGKVMQRLDADD
jgi:hypothetical protein